MNYRQFQAESPTRDTFLRFLSKETGKRIRGHRSLEIIPESMFFLPMNQSLSKDVYEYGFMEEMEDTLEYCRENYEHTFLNLESNRNMTTPWLLEWADEVVVWIPGNWKAFEELYDKCKSILGRCTIVLMEDRTSLLSLNGLIRRIKRKYPFAKGKVFGISPTNELQCAFEEGKIVEYVCNYYSIGKLSKEYECIREVKGMVNRLLKTGERESHPNYSPGFLEAYKQNEKSSGLPQNNMETEELFVAEHVY